MTGRPGTAPAIGIATAVVSWLVVVGLALLFAFDVVGRYVLLQPLPIETVDRGLRVAGGLMILAICLAAIDVLAEIHDGSAGGGGDRRTRLAFWPGHGLAVVGAVVMLVVTAALSRGGLAVLAAPLGLLGEHSTAALLFAVAVPAILAPPRLRGTLAIMGVPLAGLALLAMSWEFSLARQILQLLALLVPIGVLLLVVGLATGVLQLVWGATSGLLLLFLLGPVATGIATPTEALAVAALIAMPTGLILHLTLGEGRLVQSLVDGGREMAAVLAIVLMSAVLSRLMALLGWSEAIAAHALNAPWPVVAGLIVAAVVAVGYWATPMLAIGLCGVLVGPIVRLGGYEPGKAALLIVMAALAATVLRLVPATAAAERRLGRAAAAGIAAGILVIAVAFLGFVRLPGPI